MVKLSQIADDMIAQATRQQKSIRELGHGLRLELIICGGQRILTLSRPTVKPSEAEISICRMVFDVPIDTRAIEHDTNKVIIRWQ